MPTKVNRQAVDLSHYPNLVVGHLGMRVNRLTGLKTLFGLGPKISATVKARAAARSQQASAGEPVRLESDLTER